MPPRVKVFNADLNHYLSTPTPGLLFNPLTDVDSRFREHSEMVEFYKMCSQFFSPEFGIRYLSNFNLYPFQMSAVRAIDIHKFPMLLFTRGGGKTIMLAICAIYHAIMNPGSRIIVISGTFRQSKLIFKEIERIFKNAPLLQQLADKPPTFLNDHCHFQINGSSVIALPLGAGDKIRGERGHVIFVDEFDSINKEIFDIVIRGFGATQADPWEKTRSILLRLKKLKSTPSAITDQIGSLDTILTSAEAGNKIVISGTAGMAMGPFYKLYSQYLKIIKNQISGNLKDYADIIGADDIEEEVTVDHSQYCIITYTYKEIPIGMLDVEMIHNARATMSKMYFDMEYNCKFADDSAGFFKWRDIVEATAEPPNGFTAIAQGRAGSQYIMAIDPARTRDRFAVVIIELGNPSRVVYVWSSRNERYVDSFKACRRFMRLFNVIAIGLDTGGGGLTIKDMFEQEEYMKPGDRPVVPHDFDETKGPLPEGAQKILYPFAFNPTWIEESNMLLQKNIEDKALMFPVENLIDSKDTKRFELMDSATDEIRKMKRELISIEITYSQSGAKRFNLKPPDIKSEPGEVVTHKDRYSALLMASYLASRLTKLEVFDPQAKRAEGYQDPDTLGGWLEDFHYDVAGDDDDTDL